MQATVAASVSFTIPAATLPNPDKPYHTAECVVRSTTKTQYRWGPNGTTAVRLTGITLDRRASVSTYATTAGAFGQLLIFGDSITEGVRTLGESAASDTDRKDARSSCADALGRQFGEFGLIGFGGSGLTVGG